MIKEKTPPGWTDISGIMLFDTFTRIPHRLVSISDTRPSGDTMIISENMINGMRCLRCITNYRVLEIGELEKLMVDLNKNN
jgi:hypothetical protein